MELKIKKETAKKIYAGAPDSLKEILVETFGEECFRKTDFNDFKTFEDLCRAIGTTETEFNQRWDPAVFDQSSIAFERLKICTRAYNQDWQFNTYDTNQKKWFPWYNVSSSGLDFADSDYGCDSAHTYVGSRLCFESEEKSDHAGRTFIKLFEDFITAKY